MLRIARQKSTGAEIPNFLQKSDTKFKEFHNTLDNVYLKLNEVGIGIISKFILQFFQMLTLWETGILGTHSPEALLTAFHGEQEHCGLTFTMLT